MGEWYRTVWKKKPLWSRWLFFIGLVMMLLSVKTVGALVHVPDYVWPRNLAAIGTGITFLSAVTLFFSSETGHPIGYLLLEHNALSLGRTQFFLWLLPAICIYGGLLLPDLKLADFPPALAPILGGSLATALLGGLAAPSKETVAHLDATHNAQTSAGSDAARDLVTQLTDSIQSSDLTPEDKQKAIALVKTDFANAAFAQQADTAAPAQPDFDLINLVQDFKYQGDITRYQLLFLTALGAVVLLGGFLLTGQVTPNDQPIPPGLLYLMGGSALGYVGTKAVKTVTVENEYQRKH